MINETVEIQNIYDDVTALQEQVAALTARIVALEENAADSGWIDLTLAEGVNPYTEGSKPQYRKIRNKVYLKGAVKNILNYDTVIGTLPAGFRPVRTGHSYVQNTSYSNNAANFSRITIETNGNIEIQRISSGASFGADKWFPVHTEFLAD